MRTKHTITPEMLSDALLDGIPCKAVAWIESTYVDVIDRKGKPQAVEGVRTWHGTAVFDKDDFKDGQWFSRTVSYYGKLLDGEETFDIASEVYVTATRRRKRRIAETDRAGRPIDLQVHVDFTGAGSPFPRNRSKGPEAGRSTRPPVQSEP